MNWAGLSIAAGALAVALVSPGAAIALAIVAVVVFIRS